ncbi:MAG: CPBP family intramembrane glutamic endopeptidase [Flavisolibacter sp.]
MPPGKHIPFSQTYMRRRLLRRQSPFLLSLAVMGFAFFFPHYGGLPIFGYPLIVLALIWAYLHFVTGERWGDLYFRFKRFRVSAVWIGIAGAILLSCFFQWVWQPFMNRVLPGQPINLSDFHSIRHNTTNYLIILVLALLVGGFYEELVFHGFIFTRLEKIFPGRYATAAAFVGTNVIFGAYHFQQGIQGVFLAGLAGMAYQAFILKFHRNLWYGIFFHAFFDFIGLTFIYLGYN